MEFNFILINHIRNYRNQQELCLFIFCLFLFRIHLTLGVWDTGKDTLVYDTAFSNNTYFDVSAKNNRIIPKLSSAGRLGNLINVRNSIKISNIQSILKDELSTKMGKFSLTILESVCSLKVYRFINIDK